MDNVADRVKKVVVEQLGVNEDEVTNEASFVDDLGADSLDTVYGKRKVASFPILSPGIPWENTPLWWLRMRWILWTPYVWSRNGAV